MKRRKSSFFYFIRYIRHNKHILGFVTAFLVLLIAVSTAMMSQTEEVASANLRIEAGRTIHRLPRFSFLSDVKEEQNPLKAEAVPQMSWAIRDYYKNIGEDYDFVEKYKNIRTYSKLGRYPNTYIAFVTYDMKIKDAYTLLPGLDTLYVYQDADHRYFVKAIKPEGALAKSVEAMQQHDDVLKLTKSVQRKYDEAISSDRILSESLRTLKQACKRED